MKYSALAILGSILLSNNNDCVNAFSTPTNSRGSRMSPLAMAMDAPAAPASDLPIITSRGGAPVDVRYSDFLKLVNADKVEKATFSADGTQLLGVDTEGVRLKIEALPNDPDLLTSLTNHKVSSIRYISFRLFLIVLLVMFFFPSSYYHSLLQSKAGKSLRRM